jgi:hypothetical protein
MDALEQQKRENFGFCKECINMEMFLVCCPRAAEKSKISVFGMYYGILELFLTQK